ncbi:MAG: hypothetical protein J2P13_04195 [Acidobacteria bacterium]|nr:hypothetical protein [Acidobacteriota bacterium]
MQGSGSHIGAVCALAATFLLGTGCSVNVNKNDNGEDKRVDIDTPFGGIHVNKGADVRDTGLSVYPGARLKPPDNTHDEKSANVDISTSVFGLKVVALEYQSNDPPDKVAAYYRNELKRYGNVLECRTRGHDYQVTRPDKGDSEELKCEGGNQGRTIELKSGTKSNQRIVAIDPKDHGSDFALVYVRTRGKEGTI